MYDFPDLPDVVEDGATFEENAFKKAKEVAEALGLPVLADDSGLCVDALGERPACTLPGTPERTAPTRITTRSFLPSWRS